MTLTTSCLLFHLLIAFTQAQHQQKPLFTTIRDGGDVMLRQRKSSSDFDREDGEQKRQQWVVYDFKPAFPPYTTGQMEELLLIPKKLQTNVIEEESVVVDGNNTAIEEEVTIDSETSSSEEDEDRSADGTNEEETITIDDDQDDGEVGVEPSSSEIDNVNTTVVDTSQIDNSEEEEEEVDRDEEEEKEEVVTEDDGVVLAGGIAPVQTIDNVDNDNNNDVVEMAKDEGEHDNAAKAPQMGGDADAPPSIDSDDVVVEAETIEEGSPSESVEEHHEHHDESDVVPAVESYNAVAPPPTGPLPEPEPDAYGGTKTGTDVGLDESSEEENEPTIESESGIESLEKDDDDDDEEEEPPLKQQQTKVEDVAESDMDESVGINEGSTEDSAEILTTDEEDDHGVFNNDGGVQQEVQPKSDTTNVVDEDDETPIVLDNDAPSPETIKSSTEESPDTMTTMDEEKINIQYDDPLPPTSSSSPPSSNNKDANRQFVTGLDDVDKFFESVEVPDELDVGADGSSMQDVLVGQALKIITKKVKSLGGAIKVKFDKIATPVKKALPQLGLFGGDDDDETEIDALFESLVNGNEKMVKANLPEEDDDDADSKLNKKLQQLKGKVKELPLVKSEKAQKVIKFTKDKWEKGKQLFDDLLNIFEGDDDDDDGAFDLSKMNLDDIQSLVR